MLGKERGSQDADFHFKGGYCKLIMNRKNLSDKTGFLFAILTQWRIFASD